LRPECATLGAKDCEQITVAVPPAMRTPGSVLPRDR
jgi:hypothetical protein